MKEIEEMSMKEIAKHFELFITEPMTDEALHDYIDRSINANLRTFICAPRYIAEARRYINGRDILLASGGAFPDGKETATVKALIAKECVERGVDVVEIPMDIEALKRGELDSIASEFKAIRAAVPNTEYKAIVECSKLTDEEIRTACRIAIDCGVNVIKTGTGKYGGPSMEQNCIVADMVKGTSCKYKVSGVKFPPAQNAYMFIKAGASMIGKGTDVFDTIEGIIFLRQRGLVDGPVESFYETETCKTNIETEKGKVGTYDSKSY